MHLAILQHVKALLLNCILVRKSFLVFLHQIFRYSRPKGPINFRVFLQDQSYRGKTWKNQHGESLSNRIDQTSMVDEHNGTLPKTNSLPPLKIRPSQKERIIFHPSIFRCENVSFVREGYFLKRNYDSIILEKLKLNNCTYKKEFIQLISPPWMILCFMKWLEKHPYRIIQGGSTYSTNFLVQRPRCKKLPETPG